MRTLAQIYLRRWIFWRNRAGLCSGIEAQYAQSRADRCIRHWERLALLHYGGSK
jgi:hypothetical protein